MAVQIVNELEDGADPAWVIALFVPHVKIEKYPWDPDHHIITSPHGDEGVIWELENMGFEVAIVREA